MAKTPTIRQKRAAKAVVENMASSNPLPVGKVLANVGYGQIVQDPKRIIESAGFKAALAEFGLTEELITTSLVEDIKAKPAARVKELGLGADILGMRKREEEPTKPTSGNTYNFIFSPEVQKDVKEIEDRIKAQLLKPNVQTN